MVHCVHTYIQYMKKIYKAPKQAVTMHLEIEIGVDGRTDTKRTDGRAAYPNTNACRAVEA